MANQIMFCRNQACRAHVEEWQAFCTECWTKNYSTEVMREMSNVTVVENLEDLQLAAFNVEESEKEDFILIEGNLTQQVTKTFNSRAKQAGRWKRRVGRGAVAVGKAALIAAATHATYQYSTQANGEKARGQGGNVPKEEEPKWMNQTNVAVPVVSALATLGFETASLSIDGKDEHRALPYADEIDILYAVGFRIRKNCGEYVVLQNIDVKSDVFEKVQNVYKEKMNQMKEAVKNSKVTKKMKGGLEKFI